MVKSVAVFAHYQRDNRVLGYVIYYLQQLKQLVDCVIFVSVAKLAEPELELLRQYVDHIILRSNHGYDFYSYKLGIDSIQDLASLQQLILCNDSCIGPLFSLKPCFAQMNGRAADFWSISASSRPSYHLQSYFMVFKPQVINSLQFSEFWRDLKVLNAKDQIVFEYEVGLSKLLLAAGFRADSWIANRPAVNCLALLWRKLQIVGAEFRQPGSRYRWKILFESLARLDKVLILYDYLLWQHELIFLKKSLLKDHWVQAAKLQRLLEECCDYPYSLISEVINSDA